MLDILWKPYFSAFQLSERNENFSPTLSFSFSRFSARYHEDDAMQIIIFILYLRMSKALFFPFHGNIV